MAGRLYNAIRMAQGTAKSKGHVRPCSKRSSRCPMKQRCSSGGMYAKHDWPAFSPAATCDVAAGEKAGQSRLHQAADETTCTSCCHQLHVELCAMILAMVTVTVSSSVLPLPHFQALM